MEADVGSRVGIVNDGDGRGGVRAGVVGVMGQKGETPQIDRRHDHLLAGRVCPIHPGRGLGRLKSIRHAKDQFVDFAAQGHGEVAPVRALAGQHAELAVRHLIEQDRPAIERRDDRRHFEVGIDWFVDLHQVAGAIGCLQENS